MTDAGVWSTVVNPPVSPLDQKNRRTAQGKSALVRWSTPKYDVSEVENRKSGTRTYQYIEKYPFGVDRLTTGDRRLPLLRFSWSPLSTGGVDHHDHEMEVGR